MTKPFDDNETPKQRDEHAILAEIVQQKTSYAELMRDKNRTHAQEQAAVDEIKKLTREFDSYLTTGAVDCDNCGNRPIGMLKTPAHENHGAPVPAIFEVGCPHCPPFLVWRTDGKALLLSSDSAFASEIVSELTARGETQLPETLRVAVKRRSYSARGTSAAEARERWNTKQWVEDFYFDRIRGFTPEFAPEEEEAAA